MNITPQTRVAFALLTLRLGVLVVMLVWTFDKFFNPEHAARVFGKFYFMEGLEPPALYAIGIAELLILIGFAIGYQKRLTYGAVFVFHAVSTLSSYQQYLAPFENLLFFAAWPMLAACFALYFLRDMDTLWTVDRGGRP